MATHLKDGGPAFPLENPRHLENGELFKQIVGMSKREVYAAHALGGLCCNLTLRQIWSPQDVAGQARAYADALIDELSREAERSDV